MKEVTTIVSLEVTSINKIEDSAGIELIRDEFAENLKKYLDVDDVVVTNVQNFEREIPEVKKPKIIFSSKEQMEKFFDDINWATCPSVVGLEASSECEHALGNSPICIDCWKNAFDWEIAEEGKE